MFVDNLLDDGQAKAGTAGLGGDIRFEDARQQLDRKAGAVVGQRQAGMATALLGADDDAGACPPFEGILNQEAMWSIKAYLETRRERPL